MYIYNSDILEHYYSLFKLIVLKYNIENHPTIYFIKLIVYSNIINRNNSHYKFFSLNFHFTSQKLTSDLVRNNLTYLESKSCYILLDGEIYTKQ